MSFRCINAFVFGEKVFPNGYEAGDDDPILKSHRDHFAEVQAGSVGLAIEQATATPGGLRATPAKKATPKAAKPAGSKSETDGNSKEETGS